MEITGKTTAAVGGKRKRLQAILVAASLTVGLAIGAGGRLLLGCTNQGTQVVAAGECNKCPVYQQCTWNGKCLTWDQTWGEHHTCGGVVTGDYCANDGFYYTQDTWQSAGCDNSGGVCYTVNYSSLQVQDVGEFSCPPSD